MGLRVLMLAGLMSAAAGAVSAAPPAPAPVAAPASPSKSVAIGFGYAHMGPPGGPWRTVEWVAEPNRDQVLALEKAQGHNARFSNFVYDCRVAADGALADCADMHPLPAPTPEEQAGATARAAFLTLFRAPLTTAQGIRTEGFRVIIFLEPSNGVLYAPPMVVAAPAPRS